MKQITQFFLEDESLTLIVNIEPWKKCIERETNFKNNRDAAIIFFNFRVVKISMIELVFKFYTRRFIHTKQDCLTFWE